MHTIPESYPSLASTPDYQAALRQVAQFFGDSAQSYVLTVHVNSDGDAIGSQLGLYHILLRAGKDVQMINPSPVPQNMLFLAGAENILVIDPERDAAAIEQADRIVVLDVNTPKRLPGLEPHIFASSAHKIVIDHHSNPADFADYYLVNTETIATAQILCDLFAHMQLDLMPAEATALYTAIVTDSGNFRFPRVTADLHMRIADLLRAGAVPFEIYEQVYNQGSLERMRLLGRALAGLDLFYNGQVGVMRVTAAMNNGEFPDSSLTEGFVNQILSIRGVVIGALISERPGQISLSIRSKGARHINELAESFGGGGHKNAAGGRVDDGDFEQVVQTFIERVADYITEREV